MTKSEFFDFGGFGTRSSRQILLLAAVLFLMICLPPAYGAVVEDLLDRSVQLDIAEHTQLEDALIVLATKAGLEVMMNTTTVSGQFTPGFRGILTVRKALALLLRGSGLSYTEKGNKLFIVQSRSFVQSTLRGTVAVASEYSDLVGSSSEATTNSNTLQEIIVTAQKREERLQDVPVPVAVVNTEALAESNQVKMTDYYMEIPGLSIAPGPFAASNLSIRGITTGGITNATVGIMIDGIPFGTTGSAQIPDLDPGDLARIEVLRGPQGTLYGVSSLGGLVQFVTREPSVTRTEGRLEAGTDSVQHGVDLGYTFRGFISAPITESLSVSASAFARRDSGYIDDIYLGVDGYDQAYASGGRLAALWHPSDAYSLKLSAMYQDLRANSTSLTSGPGLGNQPVGDLEQTFIRNGSGYDRQVQAYSAIFTANFGSFGFSSNTGYNVSAVHNGDDSSVALGTYSLQYFGVNGAPSFSLNRGAKVSQEFRLNVTVDNVFEALLGGFYTREENNFTQAIDGSDPRTGEIFGVGYYDAIRSTFTEYALFTDLTYHVTRSFDIQGGVRASKQDSVTPANYISGAFIPSPDWYASTTPVLNPAFGFHSKPITYLLTPQYKISSDLMVYIRFSTGYRAGGSNQGTPDAPAQYGPDKTADYELGMKGDFLSNLISVDASLYYIDWNKIQISLITPNGQFAYTGNAGRAKSQGIELSVGVRPLKGMQLSAWATFADAKVTSLPPSCTALNSGSCLPSGSPLSDAVGQPLPYSGRFSGHFSITQDWELTESMTGYLGGELSYLGDRRDSFVGGGPRTDLHAYAKADFKLGLRHKSWTESLYINNATNRRGLLQGDLATQKFYFIQPRTVGLSVAHEF